MNGHVTRLLKVPEVIGMKLASLIEPSSFSRALLLFFPVILALLLVHTVQPQKVFDPPQVVLDYRCPTYTFPGNTPIVMRAEIIGAKELLDEQQAKRILFKWELSEGKLLSGQGTGKVTVDTSGIAKGKISCIDVKLQVEGAPPYMEREKTCKLRIDPKCDAPILFDEYGEASGREDRQHLDRLAAYLKDAGPDATAYIISYAGRSACHYEADWRADRVRKYLVETAKVLNNHIITVDGGVRENWNVDLFVQAQGTCGPLPSPTLHRNEAQVRGQCSEKYKDNQ